MNHWLLPGLAKISQKVGMLADATFEFPCRALFARTASVVFGISTRKRIHLKALSPETSKSLSELIAEVLFWPARILLLALLVASPWYYGSVTWQAQTYYLPAAIVIVVLAIAGALLRKEACSNPLVWCLAGLLSIALLQTVRLPEWLWQSVSSSAAFERTTKNTELEFLLAMRIDPTDTKDSEAEQIKIEETPRTLSIHWVQTQASAAMFAVALVCLLSAGVLFRTRNWEVVLLSVLAVSGLAIAVLGLVQSVSWNKWTLLAMPTKTYFATYVSRNSAPQFLAIGLGAVLGLLAWWSGSKSDEADKKYYLRYPAINAIARFRRRLEELVTELDVLSLLCVFSATLLFVAILAAGSRGGILSCLAAAILTLCVSLGRKRSYARTVGLVTVMTCGAMLLLTTLELDSAILNRMNSVNEEAYNLNNGRILVWEMILSQPSCWLPGCGLGNFHFAILPAYQSEPTAWFYHAENIYIELLAEFGVIGFALGMMGLGWLVLRIRWCVLAGQRAAPTFVATTLTVSAVALQSLVDFSLIIPSICLPLAALVGCFLGRSYCSDFGNKPARSEHRKRDRDFPERRTEGRLAIASGGSNAASSVALLVLILFSIWIGTKPLNGFAFAEQLNTQLSMLEKSARNEHWQGAGQLLASIDIAQVERFADHPEVNLQIGRLLQAFVGESFEKALKWPENVTAAQRTTLSEPANIAASFRAKNDPRMLELRNLASQLPQQVEALKRSAVRMAAAASVCSLDWRSGLGVVRSDMNLFALETRARNYARLLQVTGQSASLPASIGAATLLAGEKQIGNRFLHDYLARVPQKVAAIATNFVDLMPPEVSPVEAARELLLLLPNSPLLQVEVAEHFSHLAGRERVSQQLASSIDLRELYAQADVAKVRDPRNSKLWLLVAWLANARGETKTQLEALANAIDADPMNHAMRFELAKLLLDNGKKSEAIQQAERASRLSPETRLYKEFVDQVRLNN